MRLALLVLLATVTSGCFAGGTYAGSGGSPGPAAMTFRGDGIVFSYPAAWAHRRPGFQTMETSGLVDLSTQPMSNPCRRTAQGATCGWPVTRLAAGGIVVRVTAGGLPSYLLPRPGRAVHASRPGICSALGADETIRARIVTLNRAIFEVDVCLRRPGLRRGEAQVRAMLRSLRENPPTVSVPGLVRMVGGPKGGFRPLPGAKIRFVGVRDSATVRSDFRGEFLLTVLPGVYRVQLVGAGYPALTPRRIVVGAALRPVTLHESIK